ncbi:MAG TPA: single-stranded DNA-binding protein [Sporichthyaceae bacterium]|jgi:single-strand DNA-binding protein|nr:single-stranded DNA-binding protein [Sporichthyaceae bacterium]
MSKTMITVTGNLGTTPEVRLTPRGTAMSRIRIATTDRKRQTNGTWADGDTTWHTVVAWGTLAEATTELPKGAPLIVHGRLAHRTFTDTTGADREVWEITADTMAPPCAPVASRRRPGRGSPATRTSRGNGPRRFDRSRQGAPRHAGKPGGHAIGTSPGPRCPTDPDSLSRMRHVPQRVLSS